MYLLTQNRNGAGNAMLPGFYVNVHGMVGLNLLLKLLIIDFSTLMKESH